ncbi:MAG TPA: nucleotidyltransferase domain-containing protein [Spirochaetota bacterium]|nr:nucleotidyltransferase domain-containing protein [Spirochaetota bacterium]HQO02726.1 nucleotidyltransferase domain-containing protein [Spirochaetota bacterium]
MEPIQLLDEIKSELVHNFDDLIQKVILFGSRIEGNAREYSDYDVLVVISRSINWEERDRIRDVLAELNIRYDIIIDTHIISEPELRTIKGKQPFIETAFETGIAV